MSASSRLEDARATAEFAVGTGLIQNAHITGFRKDYTVLAPDVVDAILAPHVRWAIEALIQEANEKDVS